MLRILVCAAIKGGYLSRNSLNKSPIFGRLFINIGELSRNWTKIAKNGPLSVKSQQKCGYESKFRYLEEGTVLQTWWQTHVNRKVM